MKIILLTLFPEYFVTPFATSMLKRAQAAGVVTFEVVNIREFASDKHRVTDDRPFGGGAGMVMLVEPIDRALQAVQPLWPHPAHKRVLMSAKGSPFVQATARAFSQLEELVIICGHYEGVDERVAEHLIDVEIRWGDAVLTGGEPAAAAIVDSVTRLLPGVLGNSLSLEKESHDEPGFLAAPQYSRPREYNGWSVPPVLLEGNHKEIQLWKAEQQQARKSE
jgi:tRNA (guanine37-N1)-methyltransferase